MNPLVSPLQSFDVDDMLGACVQVPPSATVRAIVEIIVGAIVAALVGAGVAITLTTIHTLRSASMDTTISTHESDDSNIRKFHEST